MQSTAAAANLFSGEGWQAINNYRRSSKQALAPLPALDSSGYFQRLLFQVKRALEHNREAAHNLAEAHQWLLQVADCLNYPPNSPAHAGRHFTSHQVAANMEKLINSFHYSKTQRPQSLLFTGLRKRWRLHQKELPLL